MKRTALSAALRAALGLAPLLALGACKQEARRPSILLITLDTTRADRLGCYGYDKPTSPNLDRLAADAVRFTHAYATSSWTLPTHASIFTGKFPSSHGAKYDQDGPINLVQGIQGDPRWNAYKARPLAANEVTLASVLADHGYATGAVVAGPWLKRIFSLDKGFEHYDDEHFQNLGEAVGELNGRPAADVTRAAIEFVDAHADEPFFLFLNYYDPHYPRLPREPYRSRFWPHPDPPTPTAEFQNALYDAEVAYMDQHVGALLDHLRLSGAYDDLWIIVLSDHGELLGEDHLWGHGDSLSEKEIEIPLLVKAPGKDHARGVDESYVQQVDILPTILERLRIPLPPNVQGVPIGSSAAHPIVAETNPLPFMSQAKTDWRQKGEWRALVHGREKFLWSGLGNHALYDLARDPLELENRAALEPELARRMQSALETYLAGLPPPGAAGAVMQPGQDVLKELQSLGYLGGSEPAAELEPKAPDAGTDAGSKPASPAPEATPSKP